MIIKGGIPHGGDFVSYNDHRIAMAMAVLSLGATSPSTLAGDDAVSISYPGFFEDLSHLRG